MKQLFTHFGKRALNEVVTWLNEYFEIMSEGIAAEGGVFNRYRGDAVIEKHTAYRYLIEKLGIAKVKGKAKGIMLFTLKP